MYSVTSVPATPPPGATTTTTATEGFTPTSASSMDYDSFLQLLVTQMQHQDPLNPMDDTEYIAQLATFSNVEQNIMTNQRLDAVLTAQALGDAGAMIGRTVTTAEGQSGVVSEVQVTSSGMTVVFDDGTTAPVGAGATIS
ncbi:flagellar hook assembly protein FlgD [Acuticoccus sediminis]|uniref:flagellar hook assembly protein FlgD n=1 Tax=Acuticoccus sediminis TaxID=2184697 RepID=UPI0021F543C8